MKTLDVFFLVRIATEQTDMLEAIFEAQQVLEEADLDGIPLATVPEDAEVGIPLPGDSLVN